MKITLTKAGKNVRISFDPTETTQPDMLEDSANVEVTYQNLNNNVTVSITGGANFQTGNITTGNFLYMDSGSGPVLINSKALFLTNYPLVFPNGGGGPVTTPDIDQVLAQGGSLTANRTVLFDSNLLIFRDTPISQEMYILPTSIQGGQNAIDFNFSDLIFRNSASTVQSLKINPTTQAVQMGDFLGGMSLASLSVNATANVISAGTGISENGFKLDFVNRGFYFGDFAGVYNSTAILIEDTANEIVFQNSQTTGFTEFKANQLKFTGSNLESGSSSGSSGQHLVIELNGVTYHIELKNP